jgi:hypothetical protein
MTEYKKLEILGKVHLYSNFPYYRTVRDLFMNSRIKLIHADYLNYKKEFTWVNIEEDIKSMDIWSSYDGCGDVKIYTKDKSDLYIEVTVYDGDSFGGERKNKRFNALFKADQLDVIRVFSESINSRFRSRAEDIYSDRLDAEKQRAIDMIEKEMLEKQK